MPNIYWGVKCNVTSKNKSSSKQPTPWQACIQIGFLNFKLLEIKSRLKDTGKLYCRTSLRRECNFHWVAESSFPQEHGFPWKTWNLPSSSSEWRGEAQSAFSTQLHSRRAAIWACGSNQDVFLLLSFQTKLPSQSIWSRKGFHPPVVLYSSFQEVLSVLTSQLCSSWHRWKQCELWDKIASLQLCQHAWPANRSSRFVNTMISPVPASLKFLSDHFLN